MQQSSISCCRLLHCVEFKLTTIKHRAALGSGTSLVILCLCITCVPLLSSPTRVSISMSANLHRDTVEINWTGWLVVDGNNHW